MNDQQDKKNNLARKIAEVMAELHGIKKTGRNVTQNYDFVEAAEVANLIRPKLAQRGVAIFASAIDRQEEQITAKSGASGLRVVTTMQFTLVDSETGEMMTVQHYGEGQDYGDKAINKSYTAALKYFLLDNFILGSKEDAEADTSTDTDQPIDRKQPESDSEVNPFTGRETPVYPGIDLPKPGAKGINQVRALLGHAQVLGWAEEEIMTWVKQRTGKAPCELTGPQAKALLAAIKKEATNVPSTD